MSESESADSVAAPISARAETEHVNSGHIDRITVALQRAKSRQRKIFIVAGFVLLVALFSTLGLIGFSNGTAIDVQPDDAREIAVISIVDGFGMTIGNAVYSLSVNPTVEVSAVGFRSKRKTIQSTETGGTVMLELSELPGLLSIKTEPGSENTRWFIDGQMVVVAELLHHDLFAGEYVVEIDSPYFRKKKIPVIMERGETTELTVDLEQISGLLNIKASPAGASIRINGEQLGSSPLSLTRAGGSYRIEVALENHLSISESVEITNAETVIERDYRLILKDGMLHVTVFPPGGRLLLNGKNISPDATLSVKAGAKHSLIYLKDGYFQQRRTITLAAGAEQNVSFNLKAEFGKVGFYATPNATVRLDGRDMGQTPLVLTLAALFHRLELHKKGYRSFKRTFTPSSKSAQQIRARLLTKQQARLAEAPKRYTNKAGIALKQFRPGGVFVMGAPRHEKGQRANEFLRTVKLTRPFYIAIHEVSRSQYSQFSKKGDSLLPVTSISWIDAALYCNWLSRQEKLTAFYDIRDGQLQGSNISSDGYRLPSEAEWEWLARKAGKSEQTRFTWGDATTIPANSGNIADEFAKGKTSHYVPNYSDGYAGVAPVGSYPPESTGLYDLTGNVSEWMHDVYTLTPPDARTVARDPLGGSQGGTHTVKGSNWRSGRITELRASYREGEKKGRDDIGFRVARYVYGGISGYGGINGQ